MLLAMNLRSPLTAVPPVLESMRADLALGPALCGLLTSIPVLCFGLLTPLAAWVIGWLGIQRSIYLTLGGAALGLMIRPFAGVPGLLAGTLLIGAALAVGNIVSLMVIARDFMARRHGVTGLYTTAINLGTMLTSSLTAPMALWWGWQGALLAWVWLPLLAWALWWWVGRHDADRPVPSQSVAQSARESGWLRRPLVWLLALAFVIHLFLYYALTAWLPSYLMQAADMSATRAGLVAASFQILSLLGAFGVPWLAHRVRLPWLLALMGLMWVLALLGLLLFPTHWAGWSLLGGIAQGGCFVVIFMLIMTHAQDLDDNRRINALVQGCGYSLASLGPVVLGQLHAVSGRWQPGWLLLLGMALVLVATGLVSSRLSAESSSKTA
ncbi:MFS transporter [Pseudaeromonas sp. ZJS20]|uniref:MFS transporter n=1 Tax=Pseudaeromonas aegiceratis TaxID=3153928 RepID=UPI00390C87CE